MFNLSDSLFDSLTERIWNRQKISDEIKREEKKTENFWSVFRYLDVSRANTIYQRVTK